MIYLCKRIVKPYNPEYHHYRNICHTCISTISTNTSHTLSPPLLPHSTIQHTDQSPVPVITCSLSFSHFTSPHLLHHLLSTIHQQKNTSIPITLGSHSSTTTHRSTPHMTTEVPDYSRSSDGARSQNHNISTNTTTTQCSSKYITTPTPHIHFVTPDISIKPSHLSNTKNILAPAPSGNEYLAKPGQGWRRLGLLPHVERQVPTIPTTSQLYTTHT